MTAGITGTTTLVRNRRQMTVHRRGCYHARRGAPWTWAEERTRGEIEEVCERNGWQLCKDCAPLEVFVRPGVKGARHRL